MRESLETNLHKKEYPLLGRFLVPALLGLALSWCPDGFSTSPVLASSLPQEPVPSIPASPEDGDTPQRVSPQWEGVSFFQSTPRIELDDTTVFISTVVDGAPWVIAIPRNIYEVKGNLEDGTPFAVGIAAMLTQLIEPYINSAKIGNYYLDFQPQSALGNLIVVVKTIDSDGDGEPDPTAGWVVENPYSAERPPKKQQVAVSSSMVLRSDGRSSALQGLSPELDALLSKEIADLTLDEFLLYLKNFTGPLIIHEFAHQMAITSDQYIYYTLENGGLVRVVRILLENSAEAAQVLGTDRLLRTLNISDSKKKEVSLGLLQTEWSRYFLAAFGSSYNHLVSDEFEYGSMLPTASTDRRLRYDQAMILIYLMSQFGQTDNLAQLERQLISGFHYESIPYSLTDEVPQDEITIQELYQQLIRIYPGNEEITPKEIQFQIIALMKKSMVFQETVNRYMSNGLSKNDAVSQALEDMSINSSIMESAMRAFVRNDTNGTQEAWKSREIIVNSNGSRYQTIAVKSHRGAGHIMTVTGDRPIKMYLAEKDNLPNVIAMVYRNGEMIEYTSGDILMPGDQLFSIANRDPEILDIQDEVPIYDDLPIGIVEVQAPLTPRQYLPFISAVRP